MFYKTGTSFSKELLTCSFQVISSAAMWTIVDAAVLEFLDPPLTFSYRRNDGYFTFNAISVYKVYVDF